MGRIATARAVRVCCSPPPPATPPENVIMLKFSSKPIAEHAEVDGVRSGVTSLRQGVDTLLNDRNVRGLRVAAVLAN